MAAASVRARVTVRVGARVFWPKLELIGALPPGRPSLPFSPLRSGTVCGWRDPAGRSTFRSGAAPAGTGRCHGVGADQPLASVSDHARMQQSYGRREISALPDRRRCAGVKDVSDQFIRSRHRTRRDREVAPRDELGHGDDVPHPSGRAGSPQAPAAAARGPRHPPARLASYRPAEDAPAPGGFRQSAWRRAHAHARHRPSRLRSLSPGAARGFAAW